MRLEVEGQSEVGSWRYPEELRQTLRIAGLRPRSEFRTSRMSHSNYFVAMFRNRGKCVIIKACLE
jgi:hypothetical protein